MANVHTSSQFQILFDKRMSEVVEERNRYNALSSVIPILYSMFTSDKAIEEFASIGSLPDIPEFDGQLSYLNTSPGYKVSVEPKEFAGGVAHEKKLLDKKLWPVMEGRAQELIDSYNRVREKKAVGPLTGAFSNAFDFMKSEEGLSLCSTAHTTKSGTSTSSGFSNSGTSALSKTRIAADRLTMRRFRNSISERIDISPDTLIVPDALAETAYTAVGYDPNTGADSNLDPSAANNAINFLYKRMKVVVIPRLDDYSTTDWYMVDSNMMKKCLFWLDATPGKYEINNTVDFETFAAKTSIYSMMGNFWKDWRWIYGNNVA